MTLVLLTADELGDLTVVADTLFGEGVSTGSEIGPKIFLVPICVSELDEGRKETLSHMGFAFAGNVLSGQFTHALASTCLQNLAAPTTTTKPDVKDVAHYYAECAVRIHEERRRHKPIDGFGFEGLIFGFSAANTACHAYRFKAYVDPDGSCVAPVEEVALEVGTLYAMGSGAIAARTEIENLQRRHKEINPFSLMHTIIADSDVPTVGGEFQAASASATGVELRPVVLFGPVASGGMGANFSVMGIDIHRMGMVAGYVPVGTPVMAQRSDDLHFTIPKEN